ncbi:MAG: shikimate dehydrogenase [Nitrospirae bacterium]|nr:shikimate dehydrogenase [Nitrospirota bacterium]
MHISGKTKIIGLFGYPVEHTLSPYMQNAAFSHCGIDYCYVPFSVHPDRLKNAVEAIRSLSLCGVNLTIPHKEACIPSLDQLDEEARIIGAVNTITSKSGRLIGHNTDGRGFVMALVEQGITIEGSRSLIIGAGGASRAVAYYLSRAASNLYIYNRTRQKAEALVSALSYAGGNAMVIDDISSVSDYDLIINATPLGLQDDDPLPLDPGLLRSSQSVCDLIYRQTPLLRQAARKGCRTVDGLGMLLWQGVYSFELWTGMQPPAEVMRTALLSVVK